MSEGNSNIATLLNQILTAIYGKDVRQSIHDAIQQCYSDVGDPALNQDAFKKAIADAIADGSLAALTLEEGSVTTPYIGDKAVTEEKISDSLLAEITSSGYVTDSSGNKYEIYVQNHIWKFHLKEKFTIFTLKMEKHTMLRLKASLKVLLSMEIHLQVIIGSIPLIAVPIWHPKEQNAQLLLLHELVH